MVKIPSPKAAAERAHYIRSQLPPGNLLAGLEWRITPEPFRLGDTLIHEIETLGRILVQFYRAVNLLYRQSVAGKQPSWVAAWLDQGKPAELIELQRSSSFKNDLPRVIRPDILLTDSGCSIVELDSVPGGIGLTAWLNRTYTGVIGGAEGMFDGFASLFGDASQVHLIISEEAATYRPEMEWLCAQLNAREAAAANGSSPEGRFRIRDSGFKDFQPGHAVYRFFELFDVPNVPCARTVFAAAHNRILPLTPPPKPIFEEKMLFALLWNRNLHDFWRRELGESFFQRLRQCVPYTWLLDPTPLPPHASLPELNLTDWRQLKHLSQRERDLILKVSGFSEIAWGSRSVSLGSDLSAVDWGQAVETALAGFNRSPYVLQRFHKPKQITATWYDFAQDRMTEMAGRVRLCPYYFLAGHFDTARATLGGVLATICPSEKKIIHGMSEAILAPCAP